MCTVEKLSFVLPDCCVVVGDFIRNVLFPKDCTRNYRLQRKFAKVTFSEVWGGGGGGLCQGGICPRPSQSGGSLSRGLCSVVSVQGGFCPGISVQGSLCQGDPPVWLYADGTHPTGMHSCFRLYFHIVCKNEDNAVVVRFLT